MPHEDESEGRITVIAGNQDGAVYQVTIVPVREDEDADDLLEITVTDEDGRHVSMTVNFYDETVKSAWMLPPEMAEIEGRADDS